jgi:hypothetical protein
MEVFKINWIEYSFTNYWWIYLILHIFCCALGYGFFHNVNTRLIAMDRAFLMFGLVIMISTILLFILILCWEIIKLPYKLGVYLKDKLKWE